MLKGNKGEWSELYVLVKLLSDGKLFQSDIDLNRNETVYYEIIKVFRDEGDNSLEFERKELVLLYSVTENDRKIIGEFSKEYLEQKVNAIYHGIVNGKGNSFEIASAEDFIDRSKILKLTAKTKSKSDISLRIYDHRLSREADLGFSIKSLLGQDSTLFNTGVGNNFIYQISPKKPVLVTEFNKSTYKPVNGNSKLTFRLKQLEEEYTSKIVFKNIQSPQLWRNLKMVDGDLPEILAFCLLYRWLDRKTQLTDLVNLLESRDPLNFYGGVESEQKLYSYKIKRFLAECAMGMTSETPWNGIYDATGGVIICKQDGDIVCFHIYDFNLFREYLLNNTMLEQPSTGEDELNPGNPRNKKGTKKYYYGWLYETNEDLFFKINLQVRFK